MDNTNENEGNIQQGGNQQGARESNQQGGQRGSSQGGDQVAQGSLEGTPMTGDDAGNMASGGGLGQSASGNGATQGAVGNGGVQGAGQQGAESGQESAVAARRQGGASSAGALRPPVDVIEDAQGITLLADMPGVSKDDLTLRLDSQGLTIEGALSLDGPQQMDSRYAEIRHQHYERTFALSRELDGEKATAELAHGVLKIRIPKTAHATPRKIPVNVTSA